MRKNQETNEPCLYDLSCGHNDLSASYSYDRSIIEPCNFNFTTRKLGDQLDEFVKTTEPH